MCEICTNVSVAAIRLQKAGKESTAGVHDEGKF